MNLDLLKQDLPHIYNISNFLVTPEKYHPHNPKYVKQWNLYRKHCIEGLWVWDQYGWRFMPPSLFFYGNFFKFETQEGKQRIFTKPKVRDIDWLIHYTYIEAAGFSGFKEDDIYSCDRALIDSKLFETVQKSNVKEDKKRYLNLHTSKGTLKQYIRAKDYLKQQHENNLGLPLYFNEARNFLLFGSRGGGKSYSVAGIICQLMLFDGLKEYSNEMIALKPKVNVNVGAGVEKFSSELVNKVVKCFDTQGTDEDLGAWGTAGSLDFIPGPFYVDWAGSYGPNNSKNPYRYEYQVETASGWQTEGSGTKLFHTNYSEKKATGSQSGSGSRNNLNAYEEIGLMGNFSEALLNNQGTVIDDKGDQFGVQIGIGTSGNIELVQQTKKCFNDPKAYSCLEFDNIWEPSEHKIGLFLPAYITNSRFKDENGNTDIMAAVEFYHQRRKVAQSADDPEVLRNEKMNYPLIPSDMWISSKGSYFPVAELLERQTRILANGDYKSGKKVDLIWDSNSKNGVKTILNMDAEPFYQYPFNKSMATQEGAIIIYEEPIEIQSDIKTDQYIYTLDPYVSENVNEGGSIGAFQVWLNPRYLKDTGHESLLVCTYYGKHSSGKDAFYENVEKIINKYGNCPRNLWYEANRGDSVRGYFTRKQKTYLLSLRPTREKGSAARERNVAEYGFMVSNKIDKMDMCTDASEFLTKKFLFNGKEQMLVETLNDNFLIDQLVQFTFEGNFDGVSAFLGFPLYLKEYEHTLVREQAKREKKNPLSYLSLNKNIFNVSKSYK